MNTLSLRSGLWSSVLLTSTFIIWIICFTGISVTSPLFIWTNLNEYISYVQNNNQFFQNAAKFAMLLFGPLYVVYLNSLYELTEKKVLVRISINFGSAFAVLSSVHYFIQLTAARFAVGEGNLNGLEHFLQANPHSVSTAIDMLGWTLFFGLSSLFIAAVFSEKRLIRLAFLANGISCLLAGVGYVFHIDVITFLFINLGVGGAFLTISIASIGWFGKLLKRNKD